MQTFTIVVQFAEGDPLVQHSTHEGIGAAFEAFALEAMCADGELSYAVELWRGDTITGSLICIFKPKGIDNGQ